MVAEVAPRPLALREHQPTGSLAIWDREQIDVIKTLICPGASDAELSLFGQVCQRTGLDPFARQIYGIMRKQRIKSGNDWQTIEKLSIQTSIDGFRLVAQRSGEYAGQAGPQWCDRDGVWRDVWLEEYPPSAARVGVYRTGWTQPTWAVATWQEYAQTDRDGKPTGMWKNMPSNQLAKCAEALGLRKTFPQELSGLYSGDEMAQADREARPVSRSEHSDSPAVVIGEVVEQPAAPVMPTDEVRAKFNDQWKKGTAKAIAIGAVPPDKPGENATLAEIRKAQKDLVEVVQTRQKLVDVMVEKTARVRELAQDSDVVADVDPAQKTDAEIYEVIESLDKMIAAGEAADTPF